MGEGGVPQHTTTQNHKVHKKKLSLLDCKKRQFRDRERETLTGTEISYRTGGGGTLDYLAVDINWK